MHTRHASAADLTASRIKGAPPFAIDYGVQCAIEIVFEERLQAAEHEIATTVRIDYECKMLRNEIFCEGITLDATKRGDAPHYTVCI